MTPPKRKKDSSARAIAGQRLGEAARLASNAADLFDEEVARVMGINRTDARCIDLIDFHERVTAGELAQAASLTTGAVTTAIDRLVAAGLVCRERGQDDRRKVYVELTANGRALVQTLYAPFKQTWLKQSLAFSDESLAAITQFLTISRRINLTYAAALRELDLPASPTLAQRLAATATLATWALPADAPQMNDPVAKKS